MVLSVSCGKKPGIYINGQRIPLEQIQYDATNFTITLPTDYPTVSAGSVTITEIDSEAINEELLLLSGVTPDPSSPDTWVGKNTSSQYGCTAAFEMMGKINDTKGAQRINLKWLIIAKPVADNQYQIDMEEYREGQYAGVIKSGKSDDLTIAFDGLAAGAYVWPYGEAYPIILVR